MLALHPTSILYFQIEFYCIKIDFGRNSSPQHDSLRRLKRIVQLYNEVRKGRKYYDHEMPQSHARDQHIVPRGRDRERQQRPDIQNITKIKQQYLFSPKQEWTPSTEKKLHNCKDLTLQQQTITQQQQNHRLRTINSRSHWADFTGQIVIPDSAVVSLDIGTHLNIYRTMYLMIIQKNLCKSATQK